MECGCGRNQHIGVGIDLCHPRLSAVGRARLMHDGEPQPTERRVGAFGQSPPQLRAVVVAPASDEPIGPGFESIEQRRFHPVAGMQHHVGIRHLVPYTAGQITGSLGDMRIGDQQEPHAPNLVAGEGGRGLALQVEVLLLADIDSDTQDSSAGEWESGRVGAADGVGAIEADAQPVTAQGERPDLGSHRAFGHNLFADIQFRGAQRLAVLACALSDELHAERQLTRLQFRRDERLLGFDAEEVVDVVELAVFDEQRVAAEARAVREDHTL